MDLFNQNLLNTVYFNKIQVFLWAIFFCANVFSQNDETLNWYFGQNAGLHFMEQQDPQTLFNGQMLAPAGCATISDIYGNLQMYTNGDRIFTKNHTLMNNGILVSLNPSEPIATQSNSGVSQNSIIIPIMDIANLYYVFTVGPNGLFYSIVDMSLYNGLGSVIKVNNPLLELSGVSKLSAVHHADGKSIWVMTTKKNENNEFSSFYAYKINTNGRIDPPVITSSQIGYKAVIEGTMKFSPNGAQIACANYRPQSVDNHLTVFNFNNQTGIVSNKKNLLTTFGFFEVVSVYGIEFSNDSRYLYATLIFQGIFNPENPNALPSPGNKINFLYRYNLESFVPQQYITTLHQETNDLAPGSLQLSRNGKIYRALSKSNGQGTDYLGVINNPDVLGAGPNYINNAINLGPNKSRRGLPNFIQSYFRTRILNKGGCLNEIIPFEVDTYADITGAQWDFGDGNTSNEISPNYVYSSPGKYNVSVSITVNNRQIKTEKEIIVYELPDLPANKELIQCDDDTDGFSVFDLSDIKEHISPNLKGSLIFYETFEDAEQDINSIPNTINYINTSPNQEIFVRVTNENNCYAITSFLIRAIYVELGVISNMYACDESDSVPGDLSGLFYLGVKGKEIKDQFDLSDSVTLAFYPSLIDAQTTQNEIMDIRYYISSSTTIWVRVKERDLSCAGLAPITLIVNDQPIINIEDSYIICADVPIVLSGDSSNDRYEWLNGDSEIISTQQQFSTINTGTYTHITYKTENGLECSSSKVFTVNGIEPPVFNIIEVDTAPNNNDNFIFVSVTGSGAYEFSLDNIVFYEGLNEYTFNNIPAGIYKVYVRDVDLCEPTIQQDVYVIGYPKFFTPNNDGVNDFWEIKGVEESAVQSIQVFDRFGKLITSLNESNYYRWNGSYQGTDLPTSDYWFKVIFNSGSINIGHFTLKR